MSSKKNKRIAVMTSGGDAPGMNAAIRAVTRTGVFHGFEVLGVKRGFDGLINKDVEVLDSRRVSEIIYRGGTILFASRSEEMMSKEGQEKAAKSANELELDALVIIGGNGSITAGSVLSAKGINVICIPATIDLDVDCSDYSIGFDTAVNTGMEAINRIRDTSSSHECCSVVEVMGRDAGHIGIWCAIAGGAEEVLIPEYKNANSEQLLIERIKESQQIGKIHSIIVIAEGFGRTQEIADLIREKTSLQVRSTILGYLQRGGSPTALDRMHASMLGYHAVKAIDAACKNKIIIFKDGKYSHVDIATGLQKKKELDPVFSELIEILAL